MNTKVRFRNIAVLKKMDFDSSEIVLNAGASLNFVRSPLLKFCMEQSIFAAVALLLALVLGSASVGFADQVVFLDIKEGKTVETALTGTIDTVTKEGVTIKDRAGIPTSIAANKIVSVQFNDEPPTLKVVRMALDSSQFDDALEQIESLMADRSSFSPLVRQEIDFLRADTKTRISLISREPAALRDAGVALFDFIRTAPESLHFYEANRLVGRLLAVMGKNDEAKKYFENLSAAPWPERKFEGKIGLANIRLDENRLDDAQSLFEEVVASDGTSPDIAVQKFYARIGLARIAALRGNFDDAQKSFDAILAEAPVEPIALQATLYNAIGTVAMQNGRDKEAISAFLHTDLLFSSAHEEHVAALRNLIQLWKKTMREDRAKNAATVLRDLYKITE